MRCSFFLSWITVVLLLGSTLLAHGQTTAVLTGYVTDATTGKPMPFANVYVNGSTRGAITDEKGALYPWPEFHWVRLKLLLHLLVISLTNAPYPI